MSNTEQETPDIAPDMMSGILAAIEKSLPSETCGVLKDRLERLVSVEGELVALKKEHGKVCVAREKADQESRIYRERQGQFEQDRDAVTAREHKCDLREKACEFREQVNDLKDKHATERVADMRGVVTDVFGNSRFKYERTTTGPAVVQGTSPGAPDQYGNAQPGSPGYVEEHTTTEKVEGEGDATPSA